MSLHQITYISISTEDEDRVDIADILDVSDRNNRQSGLTGLLLYARGSFLQVLEGRQVMLDETMARIMKDPRHIQITIVDQRPIKHREFGSWCMGCHRIDSAVVREHRAFAPVFEHGFQCVMGEGHQGEALALLREFSDALLKNPRHSG